MVDALYRYRNEKRIAESSIPAGGGHRHRRPRATPTSTNSTRCTRTCSAPPNSAPLTVASLPGRRYRAARRHRGRPAEEGIRSAQDEFATPEQREIQQLLAPSEEKAKQAEAEIKAGKDWKEVAKELGQDRYRRSRPVERARRSRTSSAMSPSAAAQPGEPAGQEPGRLAYPARRQDRAGGDADFRTGETEDRGRAEAAGSDRPPRQARQQGRRRAGRRRDAGRSRRQVRAEDDRDRRLRRERPQPRRQTRQAAARARPDPQDRLRRQSGRDQPDHRHRCRGDLRRPRRQDHPATGTALSRRQGQGDRRLAEEQKAETVTKQAEALAAAAKEDGSLAKAAGDKQLTLLAAVPCRAARRRARRCRRRWWRSLRRQARRHRHHSEPTAAYTAQLKEIQSPESVPDAAAAQLSEQIAREQRGDLAGALPRPEKRYPVAIVEREALDRMF